MVRKRENVTENAADGREPRRLRRRKSVDVEDEHVSEVSVMECLHLEHARTGRRRCFARDRIVVDVCDRRKSSVYDIFGDASMEEDGWRIVRDGPDETRSSGRLR